MFDDEQRQPPICLTIPGVGSSGLGHWQTIWESERPDCRRIELGCWNAPNRNSWVSRIEQAVIMAEGPIILVAHSLGCLAVAWWASFLGEDVAGKVRGALLVAPPDVDRLGARPDLNGFAPSPGAPLPFPAFLVASRNDPFCTIGRAQALAAKWLCDFLDIGDFGHINAESGLGNWPDGQRLLEMLIDGGVGASHRGTLPIAGPYPKPQAANVPYHSRRNW